MSDLERLNKAVDSVREAIGLEDDLPITGCKEPEYAGGRYRIIQALVAENLISVDLANIWARTYYG